MTVDILRDILAIYILREKNLGTKQKVSHIQQLQRVWCLEC